MQGNEDSDSSVSVSKGLGNQTSRPLTDAVEASLALKHLPERKGPPDRVLVADIFPIETSFMP